MPVFERLSRMWRRFFHVIAVFPQVSDALCAFSNKQGDATAANVDAFFEFF